MNWKQRHQKILDCTVTVIANWLGRGAGGEPLAGGNAPTPPSNLCPNDLGDSYA